MRLDLFSGKLTSLFSVVIDLIAIVEHACVVILTNQCDLFERRSPA